MHTPPPPHILHLDPLRPFPRPRLKPQFSIPLRQLLLPLLLPEEDREQYTVQDLDEEQETEKAPNKDESEFCKGESMARVV